jgi:hypothetical protein
MTRDREPGPVPAHMPQFTGPITLASKRSFISGSGRGNSVLSSEWLHFPTISSCDQP